jgi:hypothetical protein
MITILSNYENSIVSLVIKVLLISNKYYKGSTYNVLEEWDTGETPYEPLDLIA